MNLKQQQSEQTKKRIADAARALFVQKGYKATSIEDIVSATGSSKGNIYYHFKSKEGLFLYLIEEWDREWIVHWTERAPEYPTASGKLYFMADQLASDDLNHPLTKAADEFFRQEQKPTEVEAKVTEMRQRNLDFNEVLLAEGVAAGEFAPADAKRLALLLEAVLLGAGQLSRRLPADQTQQLYHDAITVFLHGIIHYPESSLRT